MSRYELIPAEDIGWFLPELPGREGLTVDEAVRALEADPPATINLGGIEFVIYSPETGELMGYVPDELNAPEVLDHLKGN